MAAVNPRTLTRLDGEYAICRLAANAPIPDWYRDSTFWSVTRTPNELSVVCSAARVPKGIQSEAPWHCFAVDGPIPFDETGVIASLSEPLRKAAVGIFVVSTYDTDYILVRAANVERAITAWRAAGHTVR